MQRKQLERRAYAKPEVTTNSVDAESLLSTGSHFSGAHNQGHVGGGGGDAKQGWFDEEEEESLTPNSSPRGEGSLWGLENDESIRQRR